METLGSGDKSENQYNRHEAGPIKRKPIPVNNGPQFTIPRLKKIKRDLLTDLPLDAHECQQEILAHVHKSFHFSLSAACIVFSRVLSVHNPMLSAKYLDKKRDMKSCGYPDALVADTYAFLQVENPLQVDQMCRDGVRCGNQQFSGLGVSHMAVHVCKHADILTPMKPKFGDKILLMVKVLKGKMKAVLCKNVGVQLEPTPNYDCHIAKPCVDQSAPQPPHMLFYSSQLYVYEYGDEKVEDYPRQVLPHAVIYYTVREPQFPVPKALASVPHPARAVPAPPHKGLPSSSSSPSLSSPTMPDCGPNNEVWRGRLHVRLVEGGHIYIEVAILSYYVPLTISLISPIKIHSLYPEHNAQFTFFCGLTNIAQRDEVEWRAHYFRSCIMRPRPNNEEHFKALIKHISVKKEMPTVRLPQDVFLFLMPDCLLASQLGLVRRDDESPVLHCVIMSKYSTSQAQKKHLMEKNMLFTNYGSATNWEGLFDDSDFSDEEDQNSLDSRKRHVRKSAHKMFREQKHIHNKLAAMSLADAEINFAPCSCKKLQASKSQQERNRDAEVTRVFGAMQNAAQARDIPSSACFPAGSRHRPKQRMSRHARAMPSFSPHGSSDSDAETDGGRSFSEQYSLLNNTKTVEEELSEEEITNEQMEDIIFLRKPALSAGSLSKPKPATQSASSSYKDGTAKQLTTVTAAQSSKPSLSASNHKKHSISPSLSSNPKIIPTEAVKPEPEKHIHKPKTVPVMSKIIPTEPGNSASESKDTARSEDSQATGLPSVKQDQGKIRAPPKVLKSILKTSSSSSLLIPAEPSKESNHQQPVSLSSASLFPHEDIDFGDVDMRVQHQHSMSLHPIFLSAVQPSFQTQPSHHLLQQKTSSGLSFGSWLAPGDIQSSLSPAQSPASPKVDSPASPPLDSPVSPKKDSPASPLLDSPVSPPSPVAGVDSESPASPPQSAFTNQFRSSPIAIPTSRVKHSASPEVGFLSRSHYTPSRSSNRASVREGIDNADDMKNFLNSGFDSDLDSSYEDER